MISLRKSIATATSIELQESLRTAAARLIEGIGHHAVRGHADLYLEFQKTIDALGERLETSGSDRHEILVTTDAVIQAMCLYNREIARKQSTLDGELRSLIRMLMEALGYACRGQERVTTGLRDLEKEMARAVQVDDLRTIKTSFEVCLESVRTEIDRQDREHRELRELAERVTRASSAAAREPVLIDPVTRLPDRRAAREALTAILETRRSDTHAVCARLDRLSGINASCGYEAGNEYLTLTARLIGRSLPSTATLYRWSGPGFFIIAPNQASAAQSQKSIERLNATRETHLLTAGSRTIAVGIAISSTKCAVRRWVEIDDFMGHVDAFVSGSVQQPRGSV